MRILLHLSPAMNAAHSQEATLACELLSMLRQELDRRAILIAERCTTAKQLRQQHPDIIHIIGWDADATQKLTAHADALHIPYVVTPLGAFLPWRRCKWRAFPDTTLVASSKIEHDHLRDHVQSERLRLVSSPVSTTAITAQEYATEMMDAYEQAIRLHDEAIRTDIGKRIQQMDDIGKDMADILQEALYIGYLHQRGGVTQASLDHLSYTMIHADYDEALMAERLEQLRFTSFFAQLETLLAEQSTLTEGFMPIESKPNKLITTINP